MSSTPRITSRTESLLTTRLLIALFGALCFGGVGLADDVVRLRHRSPLGLRRPVRLALEAASGTLVLALLGLNHCLPDGLALPGVGYCTLGPLAPVVWLAILVALAESARTADGMDGTVYGCAFIAMLGLMTAMTLLGWFSASASAGAAGSSGAVQPEGRVGSPCAKRNLRVDDSLDRIVDALLKLVKTP